MLFEGAAGRRSTARRTPTALGIEIVYQDLALCDNLDVVQNMFLGREAARRAASLDETDDGEARGRDADSRSR